MTLPKHIKKLRDELAHRYCEGLNKYSYALAIDAYKAGYSASQENVKELLDAMEEINKIHWSEISLDKERYLVNEIVKKYLKRFRGES